MSSSQGDPPSQNGEESDPKRPTLPSAANTRKSWRSTATAPSLNRELPNLESNSPQPKPPSRGFEKPSILNILILTGLCLATYPVFRLLTVVAKNKSLSVVRAIVAAWCWGAGFAFGWILLRIGAKHLEAASEFALVGYRSFLIHYFKQPGPR